MEWMIMPYRRYADFSGRSCRQEYWMYQLFNVLVLLFFGIALAVALTVLGASGNHVAGAPVAVAAIVLGGLFAVFVLASIVPHFAVQVRRFHDQDKSGWFSLLGFIPYVGGLTIFVFMCLEGTRGANEYGPDPRDPYGADKFDDVFG